MCVYMCICVYGIYIYRERNLLSAMSPQMTAVSAGRGTMASQLRAFRWLLVIIVFTVDII